MVPLIARNVRISDKRAMVVGFLSSVMAICRLIRATKSPPTGGSRSDGVRITPLLFMEMFARIYSMVVQIISTLRLRRCYDALDMCIKCHQFLRFINNGRKRFIKGL